jgi:hypothetical protein
MVGVDLDNTVVCLDRVFLRIARQRGLVPPGIAASKGAVRDHLRQCGQEAIWTELQGEVYGSRMGEAEPFPGVRSCLRRLLAAGRRVAIISHRTRHPYAGPRHDLHRAARSWLEEHGFFAPDGVGLDPDRVFLELTREAKLERIGAVACEHFIDDLPEFLGAEGFPAGVTRILFDPAARHADDGRFLRATSWQQIETLLGVS